ncbi:hypothetical protein [Streptomyces indiaensis]|nr:hypothetical protein [Streptomyces indiaensis]MCF1646500.1 hypothetical protein [Streptomyces indiaensis]
MVGIGVVDDADQGPARRGGDDGRLIQPGELGTGPCEVVEVAAEEGQVLGEAEDAAVELVVALLLVGPGEQLAAGVSGGAVRLSGVTRGPAAATCCCWWPSDASRAVSWVQRSIYVGPRSTRVLHGCDIFWAARVRVTGKVTGDLTGCRYYYRHDGTEYRQNVACTSKIRLGPPLD